MDEFHVGFLAFRACNGVHGIGTVVEDGCAWWYKRESGMMASGGFRVLYLPNFPSLYASGSF